MPCVDIDCPHAIHHELNSGDTEMIYNFRHDKTLTDSIKDRMLNNCQLSQGWGGGSNEKHLDINQSSFVEDCKTFHELKTTRVASNLCRITDFKNGDLLITPHIPQYGRLSIHEIEGDFPECYTYVQNDESYQNHRIKIRKSIGLEQDQEISVYNVKLTEYCAALRYLRLPVLPIPRFEQLFRGIVDEFNDNRQQEYGASELDDFLGTLARKIVNVSASELRKISSSGGEISFEALCERILISQGYEIVRRNEYDKQGGDADIRCQRTGADFSIFESGDFNLCVQVKKHEGETSEKAVEQVLKIIGDQGERTSGCVMSSADKFSPLAKKLAEDNGIVLLSKREICTVLLPYLTNYLD